MADRGRDLKVSFVSDVSQFDTDKPARGLEDLADSSDRASRAGDDLGDKFATTARKVDEAFDRIAHSSQSNLRRKLDDDVNHAKRKMGEFNDEARDSAREAAASFSGASTDVQDLGQEILANAPAAFGPAGLAIGGALAAGFGALYSKWTETKEKIKEQAGEIAQALIDSNGLIDEAFVKSKITEFVQDGTLPALAQQAREAGIPVRDFVRALAGDPKALQRVNSELNESQRQYGLNAAGSINAADAISVHNGKLDAIRAKLGITTQAVRSGTSAYQVYREAVEAPVVPIFHGQKAAQDADNYRARLEAAARRPVTFTASLDTSAAYQSFRQMERDFTNGVVRVRP